MLWALTDLGSSPAAAQGTSQGVWCAESGTDYSYNPTYCKYPTAIAAITAEGVSADSIFDTDLWFVKGFIGQDESGWISASVFFTCISGTPAPPSRCTAENFTQSPNTCAQPTGGTTPNPIDILTGSKLYRAHDFGMANGLLNLDRIFNSSPYGGAGSGGTADTIIGSIIGLANWVYDFQYEIQINDNISDPTDLATLLTPDGGAYVFQHQSGGFVPYQPSNRPNPQPTYILTLLDTWPSDPYFLQTQVTHWKMVDSQDRTWTFQSYLDPLGWYRRALPTQETDRSGRQINFSYDTNGVLQSITDNYGKTITFDWQADSQGMSREISAAHLPGGYTIKYTYNLLPTGNIASSLAEEQLLDPANTIIDSVSYDYDNTSYPWMVTGILDSASLKRFSASYDTQGRAYQSSKAGGVELYGVTYSAPGASFNRTVTNPLGKQTIFNYTRTNTGTFDQEFVGTTGVASVHCPASATSVSYGMDKFAASYQDAMGNITKNTWNSRGLANTTTEAFGTAIARTTTTNWNTTWHEPDQIVRPNATDNFTYDAQGRLHIKTITDTTTTTIPYSTNGQTRTWTYTWNSAGQPLTIQGPGGTIDTTTFTYNASGYLQKVTNKLGQDTTITAWDWRGAPTTVVDIDGVTTQFSYDAYGRILTATINPGAAQSLYQLSYNVVGDISQIMLPDNSSLSFTYDDAGRLTIVTNNLAETITYTYDLMSDRTSSIIKTAGGVVAKQSSATFDELGRVLTEVGASAQTTSFGYDLNDNETSKTDPRNKAYSYAFDALNRLYQETEPDFYQTTAAYNGNDATIGVTDARALSTSYVRDGFGDIIRRSSPDTGITDFWYNADGHITKKVDARSVETDFSYDHSGRVLTKTFPAASAENVTFGYDSTTSGNKGVGRLTSVTDQSGSTSLIYDARGNISTDTSIISGHSYNVLYGYDSVGRVLAETYPSGRIVNYTRNATGGIASITTKQNAGASVVPVATNIAYKPFGPIMSLSFGNGMATSFSYDQDYELTGINTASNGNTVQNLVFGYDPSGNITGATDNLASSRSQSFTYSDLNQLHTASGIYGSQSYAYDGVGNRLSRAVGGTTDTYAYSPTANHVSTVTTGSTVRSFSYLASGQISQDVRDGTHSFTFTANNNGRNTTTSLNGSTIGAYLYNGFEQRVQKIAGGTTVQFVYDTAGHLLEEANSSGVAQKEYIWLDDLPVALIDDSGTSPVLYFIHCDQLGSPQKITDTAGNVVWEGILDPFGNPVSIVGANWGAANWGNFLWAPVPSTLNSLRFPGQYFDSESALNQNWYRDYDPSIGRYLQSDPIGLYGGMSTYGYAGGNPLSISDPWGLWCKSNSGMTTCSYPGGPKFKLPTPDGFQDFDGSEFFYHQYDVQVPLDGANAKCVLNKLINNPTPGIPSPASPNGTDNNAVVGGIDNPVISYLTTNLNNGSPLVVNITISTSLFPWGYVARTVQNGVAHSYGEGTNWKQYGSSFPFDEFQATGNELVWGDQMRRLAQQCECGK